MRLGRDYPSKSLHLVQILCFSFSKIGCHMWHYRALMCYYLGFDVCVCLCVYVYMRIISIWPSVYIHTHIYIYICPFMVKWIYAKVSDIMDLYIYIRVGQIKMDMYTWVCIHGCRGMSVHVGRYLCGCVWHHELQSNLVNIYPVANIIKLLDICECMCL